MENSNMLDMLNYYDMIIDIDSMKSLLSQGWEIESTDNGQKRYQEKKDIPSILISVIGNHNTGKSFILSKISETLLPNSYSCSTKGLSVKYNDNKNIILLDSLGFNQSLVENDVYKLSKIRSHLEENEYIDQVSDFANDRFLTEYFILNFILYYSNIPILVLDELSFEEQELYDKAKKLIYGNQLVVIHNLKTYEKIQKVKDFIIDNLENSITFDLKKNKMIEFGEENLNNKNSFYYIEEINNNENEKNYIIHLIMAKYDTEAGDYYNQTTIQFLKKKINTCDNIQNFPIKEKIKEFILVTSKNIMEEPINDINQIIIEDNWIKLKYEEGREFKFKNSNQKILSEPLIGRRYIPQYDYFITNDEKDYRRKVLVIQLMMNGAVLDLKSKVSLVNNNYVFTLSGSKRINVQNPKEELNEKLEGFSNRFEGYFCYEIKIPSSEIELASNHVYRKSKMYGLINLEYKLLENDNLSEELNLNK